MLKTSQNSQAGISTSVQEHFQVEGQIGRGAYSQVFAAKVQGQPVALKRISQAFKTLDKAKATFWEVFLLNQLEHPQILNCLGIFNQGSDIFLVSEIMDSDLSRLIGFQPIDTPNCWHIARQILSGLTCMHDQGVIHRDIKPANLLVNVKLDIKICDFGQGCLEKSPPDIGGRTQYCSCRWYRAPEILMDAPDYSYPVDIWAFGCVLGELHSGLPVFPGRSTRDMLRLIVEVTGIPSPRAYEELGEAFLWLQDLGSPNLLPNVPGTDIHVQEVLELIFQLQPSYRISAQELGRHPVFRKLDHPLAHKESKPIKPPALRRDPKRPIPIQIQEYRNLVVQLLD